MKKIFLAILLCFLPFAAIGMQTSVQADRLERIVLVVEHLSKILREQQAGELMVLQSGKRILMRDVDPTKRVVMLPSKSWAAVAAPKIMQSLPDANLTQTVRSSSPASTLRVKQTLPMPSELRSETLISPKRVSFVEFDEGESQITQPVACPLQTVVVRVLQQTRHPWPAGDVVPGLSWKVVAAGEGGHCGYHALKNVRNMMEILAKTEPGLEPDTRVLATFINYQKFMKDSAPFINQLRSGELSWLDGDALERLHNKVAAALPILIVENVPVEGLEFHQNILLEVQRFARNPNGMLGFVWNSGVRDHVGAMGGIHWVGFVAVKRAGCLTLYCMDSGGNSGMYTNNVINLLSLTPEQIDDMLNKQQLKRVVLDEQMQGVRQVMNKMRRGTLQEFLDLTWMELLQYGRLADVYQQEVLDILIEKWARATIHQKQQLRTVWEFLAENFVDVDMSQFEALIRAR